MCELLGMSANVPTDIVFSFSGLMRRGGETGPHRDGFGIAFYEGRGCRVFLDPMPSAQSEIARLVQRYPLKSCNVISHIRQANRGRVCLENTHPFMRELWGRPWTFAHNGQLRGVKRLPLTFYQPIGTTDSEYAFCYLLDQLRLRYPRRPRRAASVHRLVAHTAAELHALGVFNFLLCDARELYAHCSNRLYWLTRQAPFGAARLVDADLRVDFSTVTGHGDIVTVIASQPLTDNETWQAMVPGELRVFRDGLAPVHFQAGRLMAGADA